MQCALLLLIWHCGVALRCGTLVSAGPCRDRSPPIRDLRNAQTFPREVGGSLRRRVRVRIAGRKLRPGAQPSRRGVSLGYRKRKRRGVPDVTFSTLKSKTEAGMQVFGNIPLPVAP